jgi:hypothetical protein
MPAARNATDAQHMNGPEIPSAKITPREQLSAVALAATTGLTTWLFFGPPTTPVVNPNTGEYTAAAVPLILGCTATLVALTVAATFFVRPLLVTPVVALSFTFGWSAAAAARDDSGMWTIGAVLALIGSLAGAGILSALTDAARKLFARR